MTENTLKISLELLYHYNCGACKKWWSVADIAPIAGAETCCPHCGTKHLTPESVMLAKDFNKEGDRGYTSVPVDLVVSGWRKADGTEFLADQHLELTLGAFHSGTVFSGSIEVSADDLGYLQMGKKLNAEVLMGIELSEPLSEEGDRT